MFYLCAPVIIIVVVLGFIFDCKEASRRSNRFIEAHLSRAFWPVQSPEAALGDEAPAAQHEPVQSSAPHATSQSDVPVVGETDLPEEEARLEAASEAVAKDTTQDQVEAAISLIEGADATRSAKRRAARKARVNVAEAEARARSKAYASRIADVAAEVVARQELPELVEEPA